MRHHVMMNKEIIRLKESILIKFIIFFIEVVAVIFSSYSTLNKSFYCLFLGRYFRE